MRTTDVLVALVEKLRGDQEELQDRIQSQARRRLSIVEANQAMEDIAINDYIAELLEFIGEKLNK